jgi:hypothetical protein
MAVTKQIYSQAPTWTAVQLADLFKNGFIGANLMTDWFDSFLSGSVENRILRVVYDGAKAYGTAYYWFMFTAGGVYYHIASGWNATTHVPTGTQYVDYFSTATNTTANHMLAGAVMSTSSSVQLTRYTSGIDASFSAFCLYGSGALRWTFWIHPPSHGVPTWVDLDKQLFHSIPYLSNIGSVYQGAGQITFRQRTMVRRSWHGWAKTDTNSNRYTTHANLALASYWMQGVSPDFYANIPYSDSDESNYYGIMLPNTNVDGNPLTPDSRPIFTGLSYNLHVAGAVFPADFGLVPHYANNTMVHQDRFIVAAGTNEWEMLVTSNLAPSTLYPKPLFLARTVG